MTVNYRVELIQGHQIRMHRYLFYLSKPTKTMKIDLILQTIRAMMQKKLFGILFCNMKHEATNAESALQTRET